MSESKSDDRRTQTAEVPLSKREKEELQTAARNAGLPLAAFLRQAGLLRSRGQPLTSPPYQKPEQPAVGMEEAKAKRKTFLG